MTPKRTFLALLFVFLAVAANGADTLTVGTVNATGNLVDVPVYVRDSSGTPLGIDQPAGSKIQSFSIRVTYAPASSVQSITFGRAGITANLTPSFESSPPAAGAISLLDTFQESTNLIPFTLDAGLPGDQVAHLVVTLSSSAPPGSQVTLSLDPTVTQLTNQGGTTKECSACTNTLTLVNGAINVPNITITLTPSPLSLNLNGSGSLTLSANAAVPSTTTVTLSSSDTTIAKVPASVDIPAGFHLATVPVTSLAAGNAHITATLPASLGSGTASATVVVSAAPVCNTPVAPAITGPAGAEVNATYVISWDAVPNATEYLVDEATDAAFTAPATTSVTTTSASFSHATNNVRYYYQVRAHNHANTCDLTSPNSNALSVLVGHAPPVPMSILPVVGSTPGNFGSYFKTSVQFYNPHATAVSGKIVFHTQGASGSANDPALAYSIAPNKTLSYGDLLPAMGVATGLGTVDIVPDATSPLPVSNVRVFNDAGAAGTTGLTEEQMSTSDALQTGDTGVLLAPADVTKFRLNIGVRTLDRGAAADVVVRDKDGNVVKTTSVSYGPTFFAQTGAANVLGGYAVTGGETISFTVTSGSLFVYGSTTDNTTNDPSVQFARKVE